MRYINCPRTTDEENLFSFQYHEEIYYCVYQDILVGTELLVWYGNEYANNLGKMTSCEIDSGIIFPILI